MFSLGMTQSHYLNGQVYCNITDLITHVMIL